MANRYFEDKHHVELYRKYRPTPPKDLVEYIIDYVKAKCSQELEVAVDVGCGSGQGTFAFSPYFKEVIGCDVSPNQIAEANGNNSSNNVTFQVSTAENLDFPDNSVQLVTASAALHWFDVEKFLLEAYRILCPGGVLAAFSYVIPDINWPQDLNKEAKLNEIFFNFAFKGEISNYLTPQSRHIVNRYSDIVFPPPSYIDFLRNESAFQIDFETSINGLANNMQTWSHFQLFRQDQGEEATQALIQDIKSKLTQVIKDDITSGGAVEDETIKASHNYCLLIARKAI